MMSSAGARSGRRRWALGAGLAILVILALAGAVLVWRPAPALRAVLSLAGQGEIEFDDLRIGLNTLELTGVRIGDPPDHRVARLRVGYRPGLLLRGQVQEVAVDGLMLRGTLDKRGLRLSGFEGAPAAADEALRLPPLPLPERVSIRDARLELTTPLGDATVPFSGDLRPEQGRAAFVLDVGRAGLQAATGQLFAAVHLEGELPFDAGSTTIEPRRIAAGLVASGRAELEADALSLPGVAEGIAGRAELALVWELGELSASLRSLALELRRLAPEWSELGSFLPTPWRLELAQPAGLAASLLADPIRIEGHGGVGLASAGPRLSAVTSVALTLGPDGALRELVVPDGEIEVRDLAVAGMRVGHGSIRVDGAGTLDDWKGALELSLTAAGEPWLGLMLQGAGAEATLEVAYAADRLSVLARDPGALRIEKLVWGDDLEADGLELLLESDPEPLFTADVSDGAVVWRQRAAIRMPEFAVTTGAAGDPLRLAAAIERLEVELAAGAAGLDGGEIALVGGAVRAPAHGLALSGIAGQMALAAGGPDPSRAVPVSIASIVHEGKPAWFAPLRLGGSVQPQGDRIGFDLELARTAGGAAVRMVGAHDLGSGEGRAEIELPPVDFAPGGLQPAGLSPLLADLAQDVSGRLAMDGAVRWGAGAGVPADLDLLVENLAFTSGPARFEQVNGVIALDRLVPPSTPPGQQLAVGLIDIGLPLTDGLLTFELEQDQLAVEQLRWQFAKGQIRAAPFTIGSAAVGFSTTLTAERLSLDEIFALTQLDGLSGEGTMHGTLPITVAGAEATIEDGELVSDGPGWVRYRPSEAPAAFQAGGENVNLLLQALENFRYETLRLTVDGRTDAEMDVGLHISGANPELYDGYPIEFNLNVEGALANVLRSGLAGYRIPDRIRERMQGFGR
jgi:Dicarboxylate transport